MIDTEAWVLPAGPAVARGQPVRGELRRERVTIPALGDEDVLVEPLYGCWEANMDHALARSPVDICRQRGEPRVVLGNAGVVRVLRGGAAVANLPEGTLCLLIPIARRDEQGYAELAFAYDAPGTVGLLARRTTVPADLLLPLPPDTKHALTRWAASVRYFTAWDNWRVALTCWRAQMDDSGADSGEPPLVFGWGGGVVLGEMGLARREGFTTAMTSASTGRLDLIAGHGITPVDRRYFPDLDYDPDLARSDAAYLRRYKTSEQAFLEVVDTLSGGRGAAIFIDNIGGPSFKATLKALSRQGVIATVGWKHGMRLWYLRASACISRHIHVHTHVWRYHDSPRIRDFQERVGWLPPIGDERIYDFDDIPALAEDYAAGRIDSYFPLFRVNPV